MVREPLTAVSLSVEAHTGIAVVTLNAPKRNNALSPQDWRLLSEILDRIETDGSVRILFIRGSGEIFCAGSDLTSWLSADETRVEDDFAVIDRVLEHVERLSVPTVAIMSGYCLGAGLQLALSCDVRLATGHVQWGMPIFRLGIQPSPAFIRRIAQVTGTSFAFDLFLRGEILGTEEAFLRGVATRSIESQSVEDAISDYGRRLAKVDPRVVCAAKTAMGVVTASARSDTSAPWKYTQHGISPARIEQALGRGRTSE